MKKYVVFVLSIILIVLMVTGCKAKKIEEVTDAEKVALEYTISKENKFVYASYDKLMELLDTEGIIYIGYPESDECKMLVEILSKITKNKEVEIYYYNPRQLQSTKGKKYQKLLEKLDQKEIIVPALYFIKEGKIIDKDISFDKNIEQVELIDEIKEKLADFYHQKFEKYLN